MDFFVDKLSFWIGFAAATIFWWVARQARPAIKTLRQIITEQVDSLKTGLSTSVEHRYRQDILRLMQDKHITAPLFSLGEIAIEPRLLAPPPPIEPGGDVHGEDLTQIAVPYMPDYPYMGGNFWAKTLTFPEALSNGANLLVMGKAGSGKSFALHYLATRVAQRHPSFGELKNLVPIIVHAGELSLPGKKGDPISVFYNALNERVSTLVEAQLSNFLKTVFESELALLLVDGMDELPQEAQKPLVEFILALQNKFPGNRYIVAASPDNISPMEKLRLHPIAIASWTPDQQKEYLQQWGELWQEHIVTQSWTRRLPEKIEPHILNNWLINNEDFQTPLMFTLKTWALYAGDIQGPSDIDSIEAYLQRMTVGIANSQPALDQLAMQMTLNQTPILQRKAAGDFVSAFEDPTAPDTFEPEVIVKIPDEEPDKVPDFLDDEDLEDLLDGLDDLDLGLDDDLLPEPEIEDLPEPEPTPNEVESLRSRQVRRMLPELVQAGILVYRPDSKIGFTHPVITGYKAACGLANLGNPQQLAATPKWSGKTIANDFLSAKADVSGIIPDLLLADEHDPMKPGLLSMNNWPRYAPSSAPYRQNLLRTLAGFLPKEDIPFCIRAKVMASLAYSNEQTIGGLFRQMLKSPEHTARWLGALGCGIIKDTQATENLGLLLYDHSVFVSRAACLALLAIGTNRALEHLTSALLQAGEEVRRAAAEALAFNPEEGHPVLKEGSKVEDLLVRRAVVFGLAKVNEPWAIEILEEIQLEDDQWVVRNAAFQVLEERKATKPNVPTPYPPLHETSWIISFAADRGQGVSPGQSGWDLLATALRDGNDDQKLAAMDIYRIKPSEGVNLIPDLFSLLAGPEGEIREAAYNTLWHLEAAGINLNLLA